MTPQIELETAFRDIEYPLLRSAGPGTRSAVALALLLSACAHAGASEDHVAAAAREGARGCDANVEQATAQVLQSIEEIQPLYEKTTWPRSLDSVRLAGVQVRIAAHPGMTPQWLERTLRCHQAKRLLEPNATSAPDPFWLAGSWLDIEVRPGREDFVAFLRGPGRTENELLEARARAFQPGRGTR